MSYFNLCVNFDLSRKERSDDVFLRGFHSILVFIFIFLVFLKFFHLLTFSIENKLKIKNVKMKLFIFYI